MSEKKIDDKKLDDLKQQVDAALLAFLRAEAKIGKTFAALAKTHSDDAVRYDFSKRCALQALEAMDRFMNRVPADAKAEIEAIRAELDEIITALL